MSTTRSLRASSHSSFIRADDVTESGVGLPQVDFDVDAAGQSTFRLPVQLPPGIAGFTPKLELVYGHRQPNGYMGVGWSINGLSAITRVKATYAVDGFNGSIAYDSNDRYALDGQRLINILGNYGESGTVYYTEMQTWNYVQEADGGFQVTTRNGVLMEYGTTTDSRILSADGNNVRAWALSATVDRNGNRVEYSYTQSTSGGDTGSYYPSEIRYTVRDDREADRFVQFAYEDRPDAVAYYVGGSPVFMSSRLKNITTSIKTAQRVETILTYTLQYETSKATQLSRITSIELSDGLDSNLAAATIVWSDTDSPGLSTTGTASPLNQTGEPSLLPMDVNGDGRTDFVQLWYQEGVLWATTYLATQNGDDVTFTFGSDSELDAFPQTYQIFPVDIDGDGRLDLLIAYQDPMDSGLNLAVYLSNGTGFVAASGSPFQTGDPWDAATHIKFFAMDVNGDGRTDLVEAYAQDNQLYFRAYLSQFGENPGFSAGIVSSTEDPAYPANVNAFYAMDVNGDGAMDLVRVWTDTDADVHITAYISVSTAINQVTFASSVDSNLGAFNVDQNAFLPVDVNGDGIQDVLHIWQEANSQNLHLTTFLCNAAGGFVEGPDSVFTNETIDLNHLFPISLNGSGQVSLVSPWTDTSTLLNFTIFQGSPSGTFSVVPPPAAVTANPNSIFYGGDPDGNGKADLIQVFFDMNNIPQLVPYLSTGPYNDLALSITNSLGGVVSLEYAPLSDATVYSASASSTFPNVAGCRYAQALTPAQFPAQSVLGQSIYVVQSYAKSDDSSANRFSYLFEFVVTYSDAQIDLLGRGWQGFNNVKTTSLDSGRVTSQFYNQSFPYTGTVAETRIEADGAYASDPRVPKDQTVLMRRSTTSYTAFIRQTNGTGQQVVEVLPTASQTAEYLYGEENFDFQVAKTTAYDDFGNPIQQVNLGYVDPDTDEPLFPDEVVYRYNSYQNDTLKDGWALGYRLYAKISANATDPDITIFSPGDLRLEQVTYDASTYNVASRAQWDDSNSVYLTTSYEYDAFGNRLTETAPGGFITQYEYETDYQTFKMKSTSPENDQGVSLVTTYGYDPRFGVEVARCDPNGSIFIKALDGFGRAVALQGPVPSTSGISDDNELTPFVTGSTELKALFLGAEVVTTETTSYLSDGNGGHYKQVSSLQKFPDSTDREFVWNQTYVDGLTLERETIRQSGQSDGDIVSLTDYDFDKKPVKQSLPFFSADSIIQGATPLYIVTEYDVLGRPLSRQNPTGADGEEVSTITWDYGANGDVTITQAAESDVAYVQVQQHHFYDSQDRVQQTVSTSDGNATTIFQFDRLGRMTQVTDPPTDSNPDGVSNITTHDSMDRKLTADNPDQNTTGDSSIKALTYEYDPDTGNLSKATDASGASIAYAYDAIGRLTGQTFDDGSIVSFTYDDGSSESVGHLTQVTAVDSEGTTQYQYVLDYDAYGNNSQTSLSIVGQPAAFEISASYDPQGRVVSKTLPDSSTIERDYSFARLVGISLGEASCAFPLENYHPTGRPGRLIYGQGSIDGGCVVEDYTYNPAGQIYNDTVTNPDGEVVDDSFKYDLLNQILSIGPDDGGSGSQSFTYANQRLVSATVPGFQPGSYDYDASGNLTSKDGISYKFTSHFAYSGMENDTEVYAATADACGRTKSRTVNGTTQNFEYDNLGFLCRVTSSDGSSISEMLNDYQGRRLQQVDQDGNTTIYVSSEYQVAITSDGSSAVTKNLLDDKGPLATVDANSQVQYLRRDYKGNIAHVFLSDGSIQTILAYNAYGEFVLMSGNVEPDNKYESRTWNSSTSLYYFGFRYYDPVHGRFLTPDTQLGGSSLFQPGVFNRYAFELNNPIRYVDPTGHMAAWVGGLLIGLVALFAGFVIIASAGSAAPIVGFLAAVAGGALIAGGISATAYSLSHTNDSFNWKNFGIQMGIGAAVGAVTGGLFYGLGIATAGLSFGRALLANTVGSAFISSAGDVLGQLSINAAEGNKLADGLAASAVFGFAFGALAGALGTGAGKLAERWATKTVESEMPQIERQAAYDFKTEIDAFKAKPLGSSQSEGLVSFPSPTSETVPLIRQARIDALLNGPLAKSVLQTVSSSTAFPEAFLEDRDWGWSS